ncbi:MAG: hypothetical protein AAGC63_16155, partial [Propionicimonas sp.]|nr:hypothetical protein [Propionicimonas sp.]
DWTESYTPTGPASYVAGGKAVWRQRTDAGLYNVQVVDLGMLGAGAVTTYPLAEEPEAVTDTHAILGSGGMFQRVELADPSIAVPLSLDGQFTAPGSATYASYGWVFGPAGTVFTTAWARSPGGRSVATDLDLVAPDGGFGPRPFRVSGLVPYVGVAWKTSGVDGVAVVEFVQLSGKNLNWCTREWNTATGAVRPASCRRILTTRADASVAATRYGSLVTATPSNSPVIGLTVNGTLKLWRNNRIANVATVRGATHRFTGVGDPVQPLVRAQGSLSGTIYRASVGNGALARLADDFIGRMPPTAVDLTFTRLTGLDGRDRSKAWQRPVSDTAIGAETSLDGATLGLLTSGARVVRRTSGGLQFLDRGARIGTAAAVTALRDASGPYSLVSRAGRNLVLGPNGAVVAQPSRGYQLAAVFGSVVVEQNTARTAILVRELTGKPGFPVTATIPGASGGWRISAVLAWGDTVVVGTSYGPFRYAYAFNRVTRQWGAEAANAIPVAIGDQVVAVRTVTNLPAGLALWQLGGDFNPTQAGAKVIADADTAVAPAFDGADRFLYSTGTALKVIDLHSWDGADLSGTSAPRVLGTVAATSYEINTPGGWRLALDLSRPVDDGVVEIVRAAGTATEQVVARLTAADDGDGSVRVVWNGAALDPDDPAGGVYAGTSADQLVPDGTYTWRYLASGAGGGLPVVAINGAAGVPAGTIRVFTAPIKAARPGISGTLAVGRGLTATHAWTPAGLAYAYQWYAGGVALPTATAKSYVLTPAERGKPMAVRVVATNRRGTSVQQGSKASRPVDFGTLGQKTPGISGGAPKAGGVLTANPGAWTPAATAFTYQWYRVDRKNKARPIRGATAPAYTPGAADVGNRLRVVVTGRSPGYRAAARASATTAKVATGTLIAPNPDLGGITPEATVLLSPAIGTWGPAPVTLRFAWVSVAGGRETAIPGATAASFTPRAADIGKVLRLKVTGSKAGFATLTRTATYAGPVAAAPVTPLAPAAPPDPAPGDETSTPPVDESATPASPAPTAGG